MTRFIRIRTRENQLLGINLDLIASMHVEEQASLKKKDPQTGQIEEYQADVVRFYTAQGTEFSFIVGQSITAEEYKYICYTFSEHLYKTRSELKSEAIASEKQAIKEFENLGKE